MFTQPEHLKHWWAPYPYTIVTCTIDLRPGGIWHYAMRSLQGQEHWSHSVYCEIVPPEKLVYTSTFADAHANPIAGIPEHLTTSLFTEEAGKTKATARIQFSSPAALKVALDMCMQQGMNMTWDSLEVKCMPSMRLQERRSGPSRRVVLIESSPAVANGVVYVGCDDNNLYAVNATTGIQQWAFQAGNIVYSSPAVVNRVVYVGSDDSNVYAIYA